MAQTGYTPIQLYRTTTAAAVPVAGNLNAGELAINTNDGKLYYKDSSNVVQLLAVKDPLSVSTDNTFTGTQTFNGTSAKLATALRNAGETCTVSATAATGTINYDATTQAVLFYTTNASGNWTVNFRGSAGTSLNTLLATGQSLTVAFLVTNGATAYYNTTVQVDGTTSGVTTRWQGGTAPAAGNASSVDVYAYTIIKTASATFSVFASQTRFA
jgi:hypothetical protein